MCEWEPTLTKGISQVLCLITAILFSSVIGQPQRSRAALTRSEASKWNTLYVIGPGVGGNSYGLSEMPARLSAIDLTTGREKFALNQVYDAKLSPNGSLLYVASLFRPQISVFATANGRMQWQASLQDVGEGYSTIGTDFGAAPDGHVVYIPTHYGGNDIRPSRLRIVDATKRVELPNTINLPILCQGEILTPVKGNFIYIHCANKLIFIDTTTQAIGGEYELNVPVRASLFAPSGQSLYLFVGTNGLAIFDTAQRRVVQQMSFEPNPLLDPLLNSGVLLASSVDGKRLLVAQSLYEKQGETEYKPAVCLFRIFDTTTWRKTAEFKFPSAVFAVAVNATGDAIYAVIAKKTRAKVERLRVPNTVVELNPDSGRIRRQFVRENEYISRVLVGP
jgi:hypothetical protein